ncbi:MAG: aldo/keto reductase [Verrucomicrobiaceae bacterium]|nr:MAG: aldo/keto reductase [Verrucomicrobiaceae bacterium]
MTTPPPSFLCLGTATYGAEPDEAASYDMLDAYVALGGNVIDTARIYSDWIPGEKSRSEKLIGRWLKKSGRRDDLIIATKGGHPDMDDFSKVRMSRAELTADVEASRRALGIDTIDIYWLHRDDALQPAECLLEILESFREKGWIRHYGGSNFTARRLREAAAAAARMRIPGFCASQPLGCLGARHRKPLELPLLEKLDDAAEAFHEESQLPVFPYTSQATGYFDKVHRLGRDAASLRDHPFHTPGNLEIAARLSKLSAESGYPVSVLTLAWWRTKPYPVHPIIGCRTRAQLDDSFAALAVDAATLARLRTMETAAR